MAETSIAWTPELRLAPSGATNGSRDAACSSPKGSHNSALLRCPLLRILYAFPCYVRLLDNLAGRNILIFDVESDFPVQTCFTNYLDPYSLLLHAGLHDRSASSPTATNRILVLFFGRHKARVVCSERLVGWRVYAPDNQHCAERNNQLLQHACLPSIRAGRWSFRRPAPARSAFRLPNRSRQSKLAPDAASPPQRDRATKGSGRPSKCHADADAEDTPLPFDLPAVSRKKVTADFAGGSISSDGGLVLLRAAERRFGLAEALAGCIREWRDLTLVVHTLPAMLRFRMFAIACTTSWTAGRLPTRSQRSRPAARA